MKQENANPIVDKVLKLQIHRVPILSMCDILGLTMAEVDEVMRKEGYKFINGLYTQEIPEEPIKVEKPIKKNKKVKKTKKQLLQEEINANPTRRLCEKYGVFDVKTQLYHLNTEVVKVLLMQDEEKLPIEKIAANMKMTVKVLTNFMKKNDYVLEEEVPVRKTKKPPRKIFVRTTPRYIVDLPQLTEEENEEVFTEEIPLVKVNPKAKEVKNEISLTEEEVLRVKKFYNWYLAVKDLPVFNS